MELFTPFSGAGNSVICKQFLLAIDVFSIVEFIVGNNNTGNGNGNSNYGDNHGNDQPGNGRGNGLGWEKFYWKDGRKLVQKVLSKKG